MLYQYLLDEVGRKSTGLREGQEALISRSRSERHGAKKKGKGLRRLFLGTAKDTIEFSDDSAPNTPQVPASVARTASPGEVLRRNNRLTV